MSATVTPPRPETGERPGIDPRLRARRIKVKREKGRRRLRWAVVAGAVAAALLAGLIVARSPLMAVRDVEVRGVVYTDRAAVAALVERVEGRPVLDLDSAAIRAELEALPWVRRASVRRDWPFGVDIEIVERTPVASYFGEDGRYRVVDGDGRVLVVFEDGQPADYLPIAGIGPALPPGATLPDAAQGAIRVIHSLPPTLRALVVDVALDERGDVTLGLQAGGMVHLGPPVDLREKLLAVMAVVRDVDVATIEALDVSVPSQTVCRGGCTLTGARS